VQICVVTITCSRKKKNVGNVYLKLTWWGGGGWSEVVFFVSDEAAKFFRVSSSKLCMDFDSQPWPTNKSGIPVTESPKWWRKNLSWYRKMYHAHLVSCVHSKCPDFPPFYHVNHVKKKNLWPYRCKDVFDYHICESVDKPLQINVTRQTVLYIIWRKAN